MKVLIAKDEAGFYKNAVDIFLESLASSIRDRRRFVAALSGGSTPQKFFSSLAESYYRERIPWKDVFLFWVDERCVPSNHADSNFGQVQKILLSKVPIPQSNVFRIQGEIEPPREAARAYENALRSFFKLEKSPPQFDLVQLGVGEDGHTASLFPQSEALKETEHWVATNYIEKLSSNRITLTFPILNNARRVLFMCSGKSKAQVVREIFRDDISPTRYPAQQVKPTNGELIWLLDPEAASKVSNDGRIAATHV